MTRFSPCSSPVLKHRCSDIRISLTSDMRPSPVSPHACEPLSGPNCDQFLSVRRLQLACVLKSSHITRFIAGAKHLMASEARQVVVSKLSARPCASLAMLLALAGAITMASAQRASSMCFIPEVLVSSLLSKKTGWPDSA